jgi:anhydro-N-acetylmuramic acid kinase
MDMLKEAIRSPVHRLRDLGVKGEQKEAALFALLGATRIDCIPNNVPSATGAAESVVMGKISQP